MTEAEARRQEWLAQRRLGVGGSDTPKIILGDVFGKGPLDVYSDKLGLLPDEWNNQMKRGSRLEPIVVEEVCEREGLVVVGPASDEERFEVGGPWFVRHPEHAWLYANIDSRVALDHGRWAIGEVKCPMIPRFLDIKNNGLDEYYMFQGWHQLMVCPDAEVVLFFIFNADLWDLIVVELERDPKMESLIFERLHEFWFEHVEPHVPPVDEEAVASAPLVKRKGGEYLSVDTPSWLEAVDLYLESATGLDAAKATQADAKRLLSETMKSCDIEAFITPDGHKFAYREVNGKSSLDKKRLIADTGVDLEKYTKRGESYWKFDSWPNKKALSEADAK